jgi:hypothetical protein
MRQWWGCRSARALPGIRFDIQRQQVTSLPLLVRAAVQRVTRFVAASAARGRRPARAA